MTSEAARKAWETRRARASGLAPAAPIRPAAPQTSTSDVAMNAAQKAWATRRAREATASAENSASLRDPAKISAKGTTVDRISAILAPRPEMTAGEKAAETKRLEAQARADAEALRKGFGESAITSPTVTMWIDDAKIGCGIRNFVVIEAGPRWVRMFHVATLQEILVTRIEFERYARPYEAKQLVERIDRSASVYDRNDLDYSARTVRSVREMVASYLAKGGAVTVCAKGAETVSQASWARAAA